MRKDIYLAVPAAGLFFFGAAALLLVFTTPEMAHWYIAFWISVICTPLGLTNILMLVVYEFSNPELRDRRPKLGPAIVMNLAVCLAVVGLVWHFSEKPNTTADENGVRLSDRPSLISMFVRDLEPPTGFQIAGCSEYDRPDIKGRIYYKVLGDVSSNSKFLSFYIPPSPYFLAIINSIASEYSDWIVQIENTLHVHNNVQGNSSPVLSQNMTFSNVIYIYHEDFLDAIQVGQITKAFQDKGLTLQLRGTSYLLGAWDAIKAGRIKKIAEYRMAGCRIVPVKNS